MSASSSPQNLDASGAQDKGPLSSLNLSFLKSLNEKKSTRDGNPPKRRGPKPDSKPALTRRQELNRQAQRTHRERKELYIKALEDEVFRLKEIYSNVAQDKEKLAEENRQLKGLLHQTGASPISAGIIDDISSSPSFGYASSNASGAHAPGSSHAYTTPLTTMPTAPSLSTSSQLMTGNQVIHGTASQPLAPLHADYEQAGIDFVLALERPCMVHLPWLLDRANGAGGEPSGHALMASCPPVPFSDLNKDVPFGNNDTTARHGQTWELSKSDLATLLDLSRRLDLDGEITPIMAWGKVLDHPRLTELGPEDFVKLVDELKGKVRCYGFGAVMEEFEVRDALNAVLPAEPEMGLA
ncbi:hypothetical protein DL765_004632 [Monosporascus sp. GIB2]|nr:hypothetical protein DL765_004632 [Monosporascus sp. GIB2]